MQRLIYCSNAEGRIETILKGIGDYIVSFSSFTSQKIMDSSAELGYEFYTNIVDFNGILFRRNLGQEKYTNKDFCLQKKLIYRASQVHNAKAPFYRQTLISSPLKIEILH